MLLHTAITPRTATVPAIGQAVVLGQVADVKIEILDANNKDAVIPKKATTVVGKHIAL